MPITLYAQIHYCRGTIIKSQHSRALRVFPRRHTVKTRQKTTRRRRIHFDPRTGSSRVAKEAHTAEPRERGRKVSERRLATHMIVV